MCVCVCVCVCVCACVRVCVWLSVCLSIYIRRQVVNSGPFIHFPHFQDFIYIYKKKLSYIYMYINMYIYAHILTYIYVEIDVYMGGRWRCMHVRKNTLSCTWPEKDFFFYIYEVITWERLQRKLCQPLLRRC